MKRRADIDIYKGILVWCVVLSHLLALSPAMMDTVLFKIITGFHIPLFIGISGFLFNASVLRIKSMIKRLIIPWIIANVVYLILPGTDFSVTGCIIGFVTHLWYIPSLLLFMLIIFVYDRMNFYLKLASVGLYIFTMWINTVEASHILIKCVRFLAANFRLQFLVYFFVGYLIRKYKIKCFSKSNPVLWAIIGFVLICLGNNITVVFSELLLILGNCLIILSLYPKEILKESSDSATIAGGVRFLQISGKQSMFVYLWHVVPICAFAAMDLNLLIFAIIILWQIFIAGLVYWIEKDHYKKIKILRFLGMQI